MDTCKFYQPSSVIELAAIMSGNKGEKKIIAGGTDLIVDVRQGRVRPKALIDIGRIDEMRNIYIEKNILHIGSLLTFNILMGNQLINKHIPLLAAAASKVGSPQIRNLGTIGGNVAKCSVAGDIIPALLALNAKAVVIGPEKKTEIKVQDILKDINQTNLGKDEFIKEFLVDTGEGQYYYSYQKIGPRKALAISNISVALAVKKEGDLINYASLAVGAVGRTAYKVTETENILSKLELSEDSIEHICKEFSELIFHNLGGRIEAPYKAGYKKNLAYAALKNALYEIWRGGRHEFIEL